MAEDGEDRTQAATPRRRQRAREEGQVAVSREVGPAVGLAAATLMLAFAAGPTATRAAASFADSLHRAGSADPVMALRAALWLIGVMALPFLAVAALATLLSGLAQTGLAPRLSALQPNLARLDPMRALGRIASGATLGLAVQALVKLMAVAVALFLVLRGTAGDMVAPSGWPPELLLGHVLQGALRMMMCVLAAQALIATADVIRTRFSFSRRLRMTRQEMREEMKESEGDPQIRQRIRRIRQQRARRRMMAAVPKATVVVTNPTHYAVALAYERGSTGAPRVVAKGVDTLAERIRDLARDAHVPVVCNPPLARALWQVELDAEIPVEMFQAVAEVIAVIWRLRTPRRRAAAA